MIPGPKLRKFRENRFVTQAQVAEGLGSTPQNVSNVERTASVGLGMAERYLNAVAAAVERRGQGLVRYSFQIVLVVDDDPLMVPPPDAIDLLDGWRDAPHARKSPIFREAEAFEAGRRSAGDQS